jgi:hypothetical protein
VLAYVQVKSLLQLVPRLEYLLVLLLYQLLQQLLEPLLYPLLQQLLEPQLLDRVCLASSLVTTFSVTDGSSVVPLQCARSAVVVIAARAALLLLLLL